MIKSFATLLLLFAFMAQTFQGGMIMLDYSINTASFAKNCENKARPKMHCNGRCQMYKKLKAEEKQDEKMPERKSEKKTEVLSSKSFFNSVATQFEDCVTTVYPAPKDIFIKDISYSFFHPPQV